VRDCLEEWQIWAYILAAVLLFFVSVEAVAYFAKWT
jgi:hypothetical protein